jgi:DNA adenine methylase
MPAAVARRNLLAASLVGSAVAPNGGPPSAPVARPFLKWAGSKKQLLNAFVPLFPRIAPITGYHEPFLGSGAVFFHLKAALAFARCTLSDNNSELIAAFSAVRDHADEVIVALEAHRALHSEDHFYKVRAIEPDELGAMSQVERGARLIYLNKTCFNGLYRVNSRGLFNVPMGRYANPAICDPDLIRAASAALREVSLSSGEFSDVLDRARPGDVVYFDPPYVPVSTTSYFTAYTKGAFGEAEQRQLADVYRALDARGCRVMLSNSDTTFVRRLYKGFDIRKLMARRLINSKSDRRGEVAEVVVLNYCPPVDAR